MMASLANSPAHTDFSSEHDDWQYSSEVTTTALKSEFHDFDNVEEAEAADLLSPTHVTHPHWWQRSRLPFILDLLNSQLSLTNVWRFPAIALAMSIQWQDDRIGLFNFLIPYGIVMALVAWPMLIGELGVSQITNGTSTRSFGSLGLHSRAAGLSWLMSIAICLFFSAFGAYSILFAIQAPLRVANYFTARVSTAASATRMCTRYASYVPELQPLLCLQRGNRLDVSCFDEDNCQLWAGTGRCIAVPWGPAANYRLSNADYVDPMLDNDYAQYCGARLLHDVTTNQARGVMAADAYWTDYGANFNWKLMLSFIFVWGCAIALSLCGRRLGMLLRFCIGIYGLACVIVALLCAGIWFSKNNWSSKSWLAGMFSLQPGALARPEVWGAAVVQAIFSLGIGSNQLMTKTANAPSDKYNIVWLSTYVMLFNTLFSYAVLWMVWLAFGAATSQDILLVQDDAMLATVRYDVRNMPFGQLWTALQTMFDNSATLDGTSPRPWVLSMGFWVGIGLLGINGLHHHLEAVVEPLHKSAANWKIGMGRWLWLLIMTLSFIVTSIILWWGCSWGFVIILQHFFLNFALPLVALYEAIAIGWLHGWEVRAKHFGSVSIWVQLGGYLCGCLIAGLTTAALMNHRQRWRRWIGLMFGLIVMLLSVFLPVFLQKHWDAYGRKHDFSSKLKNMVFGSVEHLRRELNYRSCHTALLMKLTVLWSILMKFVVPFGLIFAWCVCLVRGEQNWAFSPYRPFYNDQDDPFSHVERALQQYGFLQAPGMFIGVAWGLAWVIVIAIPVLFFFPRNLDWMIPPDTDANFFDVRKALELFASSVAQSQIPVRVRDREDPNGTSAASSVSPSMPNWKKEAERLSVLSPANTIKITPNPAASTVSPRPRSSSPLPISTQSSSYEFTKGDHGPKQYDLAEGMDYSPQSSSHTSSNS